MYGHFPLLVEIVKSNFLRLETPTHLNIWTLLCVLCSVKKKNALRGDQVLLFFRLSRT